MRHKDGGHWRSAALCYFRRIDLNKGDVAVDLALKFDVLAVCAVFVFVGAILLGAF